MTPLVETVARAISRKVDAHGDTERVEQQRVSYEWPRYREHAQAAIAAVFDALSEPSETAVTEGKAAWLESASDYTVLRTSLRAAHIAMLAKAREEMLG